MLLGLALLSYFLVSAYSARRAGWESRQIVVLLAAIPAGMAGAIGFMQVVGRGDVSPLYLMQTPAPGIGALMCHTLTGLFLINRRLRGGSPELSHLPNLTRIRFVDDRELASVLDELEDRVGVKYLPGQSIETETAWAYEAWAETLADGHDASTHLMIPRIAAIQLRPTKEPSHYKIEPANAEQSIILVQEAGTGGQPVAVASSNDPFCQKVMRQLQSILMAQ